MLDFGLQGDPTSPFWRRSALGFLWKEWCWSWNSSTLSTSCEELTHWKRLWCWEGLGAGGEGDDRGWDGWMASLPQWTWVWVNFGSWWWTGRPGVLWFMGSQSRTRLNDWTELNRKVTICFRLSTSLTMVFILHGGTRRFIIVHITYQNHSQKLSWGKLCLITCCLRKLFSFPLKL